MALSRYKFGELIELTNEKNTDGIYGEEDAIGVNIDKVIMSMRGNISDKDFTKFHIVPPLHFAYNPRGSRKLGLGFNDTEKTFIITFNDNVFKIKDSAKDIILPKYLFMYLSRKEWDRYAEYISWGSSTEVFDWNIFCEEEIELPSIAIQRKYVSIYQSMISNQRSYEKSLDYLKKFCHSFIENINDCDYFPIRKYIKRNNKRNKEELYNIENIKGFNNDGDFIKPMRLFSGNISTFKILNKEDFVYNSRINSSIKKLSIAFNEDEDLIVSPAYESFYVNKKDELDPFYLYMLLQRESFTRKVLFNSFGSSTLVFDINELSNMKIPVPDIKIQNNIANIYKLYKRRKAINEKLKEQLKNICSVLVKGAMEEAEREV